MDRIYKMQTKLPIHREEEELYWPLMNNYTPAGVYQKSKYDYNLTYPESNEAVREDGQQNVPDEPEEEEGSEEGEAEGEGVIANASGGGL